MLTVSGDAYSVFGLGKKHMQDRVSRVEIESREMGVPRNSDLIEDAVKLECM
jgi:hypothetical protein